MGFSVEDEDEMPVEALKDSDLIHFGKHQGEKLGDVPAQYLLWLDEQPDFRADHPRLAAYIENNRVVLEKE